MSVPKTQNYINRHRRRNEIFFLTKYKHMWKHKMDCKVEGESNSSIKHIISLNDRAYTVKSKDSQVKTQLVLWILILFKVKGDNMFQPLSPGHK
jgi:hypothetical protein